MELPAGDMQLIWYNIYILYIYIPTTWGLLKHSVHGLGLQVPQSLTIPMTKATRVEFRQNDWEGHLIKIGSVDEPSNFRILYGCISSFDPYLAISKWFKRCWEPCSNIAAIDQKHPDPWLACLRIGWNWPSRISSLPNHRDSAYSCGGVYGFSEAKPKELLLPFCCFIFWHF